MPLLKYYNAATSTWVPILAGAKGETGNTGATGAPGSLIALVSDTPPLDPTIGAHWFNSTNSKTYIYYSNSWVEIDSNGTADLTTTNILINGAFEINQRGYASSSSLSNGAYGFDRWKATADSTTLTFTSAPQGQLVTINSGKGIEQVIERQNVRAGTYVLSWQGTATGRVFNSGISPLPAFAASPIIVTLDGTQNLEVEFTASGGNRTLGFVQFQAGSVATPFRRNGTSVESELAACYRYFYASPGDVINVGYVEGLNDFGSGFYVNFPVQMRIAPSVSLSFVSLDNAINLGQSGITPLGFFQKARRSGASWPYFNYRASFSASAEL
jgi:hypothetical protein